MPVPVKSPGSATITSETSVPPSLDAQTDWLDWVRGLVASAVALGAGAGATAEVNVRPPATSKVKIHTCELAGIYMLGWTPASIDAEV